MYIYGGFFRNRDRMQKGRREAMTNQQRTYNENVRRIKATPKKSRYRLADNIDEMISPTIELLNRKGYYTSYCCSGHFNRPHSSPYIMFDPEIKTEDFPTLPPGFNAEYIEHGEFRELTQEEIAEGYTMQLNMIKSLQIFTTITGDNEYQQFIDVLTANMLLLKWAAELPERKSNSNNFE